MWEHVTLLEQNTRFMHVIGGKSFETSYNAVMSLP